jgi:hypothetical protein
VRLLVIPAKAGIQYSRAGAIEPRSRGVLGRPVKPGDDGGVWGATVRLLVIPAKAGIQYSRAGAIEPRSRGVLGRPVKPGDDGGV